MPYIPNTPESLLNRTDSKNPQTTCAGLAGSGRRCRRGISTSPPPTNNEALYCWQHKEQASPLNPPLPLCSKKGHRNENGRPTDNKHTGLVGRSSIDTLAERLGLVDLEGVQRRRTERLSEKKGNGSQSRPSMSSQPQIRPSSMHRQHGFFSSLLRCCFTTTFDDNEPSTPPKHHSQSQTYHNRHHQRVSKPPISRTSTEPLIPPNASSALRAALLAELQKPISPSDTPGYIYMFWLTPSTIPRPAQRVATDLISSSANPSVSSPRSARKMKDELNEFATGKGGTGDRGISGVNGNEKQKILTLKIGRANNVTRRMQEWKRQCGYDLTLLRYYPYLDETIEIVNSEYSSTTSDARESPNTTASRREALKTPCTHKVERLIHIELAALRVQDGGKCEACGREHREWFEVGADRDAVRVVDGIIRKWVDWSLGKRG